MAQVPIPLFPLIEPDLWISHIRLSCKHFLEGIRAAFHLAPISIRQLSRCSTMAIGCIFSPWLRAYSRPPSLQVD